MQYARIYASSGESPDVGEVLETNPLAVSLWFMGLARANVYGILPADPRRYRAKVCPAAAIHPDTVAEAIAEQERRGWVRRYETSDGHAMLHVVNYHKYQPIRWNRVGPPDCELPEWWQPPAALIQWLRSEQSTRGGNAGAWGVLRDRYCSETDNNGSTPGPLLEFDGTTPGELQERPLDRRQKAEGRRQYGGERARPHVREGSETQDAAPDDGTAPPELCSDEQTATDNDAVTEAMLASPAGRRRNSVEWAQVAVAFCSDYPDVCAPEEVVKRIGRDPPKAGDRFPDAYMLRIFPEVGRRQRQDDQWRAKVPEHVPMELADELGAAYWQAYDSRDPHCAAILEARLDELRRAG
jgi:hypothetical protein